VNVQQQIDATAFAMMHLTPEDRQRCLCDAFDQVLAKHPDLDHVPLSVITFVAALMKRITEFEQHTGGTA
jgi:hypothetical protein